MKNITNTRILYFRNKGNKRPFETRSISSSSSSTSSTTPLPLAAKVRNRQPAFIPSGSKADHQHAIPRPKSPYFDRQSNLSAGTQNSAPQYPSPPILRTPVAPIQPHAFLPHRPSPQHNRSSVLSPSFKFRPIMTQLTDSNRHKTDNTGYASASSSSSDLSTTLEERNSRTLGQVSTLLQKYPTFKTAKFSQIIQPSGTEADFIDPQILKDQIALTTQVRNFQEGVRSRMQKKYSRNHNVVTFQPGEIITLRIPKEDRASTDNHRLICMIKSIPHDGRHLLQTRFGVLDRLYPTGELNVVPEVDQIALRSDFENAPSKAITLHAVAAKVGTSNKVAVSCSCKKTCSPKSRCKCQKQKLKCTQYCHSSARDCGNMGIIEEGTETAVIERPVQISDSDSPPLLPSDSDDDPSLPEEPEHSPLPPPAQEHLEQQPLPPPSNVQISPQRRSRKPGTKRPRANTNSNRKRNKINAEAQTEEQAEVVEALNSGNHQTTLSQFELTAPVVRRLRGLQSRNKKGKKS